jgi:hypothetical protein
MPQQRSAFIRHDKLQVACMEIGRQDTTTHFADIANSRTNFGQHSELHYRHSYMWQR